MHRAILAAMVFAALAIGPAARAADVDEDRGLDDMISPVSAPTWNEDPRNTTEIRPLFIYHHTPASFLLGKGDAQVAAVQARVALHERFSFIATKDGYVWIKPDASDDQLSGWANIAFGFKGSLLQSEDWDAIISLGLRYETRSGNREIFQGRGDGVLNPFLTAAKGFGNFHIQAYTGPMIPISGKDSTEWSTNLHIDYKLPLDLPFAIYPLGEVNWINVIDGGSRYPFPQEGFDLLNLGSSNAEGNLVTMAFGMRIRFCEWFDMGATGEFPVSHRTDINDWRVTMDMIFRPFGFKPPPWPWV